MSRGNPQSILVFTVTRADTVFCISKTIVQHYWPLPRDENTFMHIFEMYRNEQWLEKERAENPAEDNTLHIAQQALEEAFRNQGPPMVSEGAAPLPCDHNLGDDAESYPHDSGRAVIRHLLMGRVLRRSSTITHPRSHRR